MCARFTLSLSLNASLDSCSDLSCGVFFHIFIHHCDQPSPRTSEMFDVTKLLTLYELSNGIVTNDIT